MKKCFSRFSFLSRTLLIAFFLGLVAVSPVFGSEISFTGESADPIEQELYTQDELVDIMSPSVVRILQHIKGTAQRPYFIIDEASHTIAIDTSKDAEIVDINRIILGTGFFVTPDGYIVTNAHYVSDSMIKLAFVDEYIKTSLKSDVIDRVFNEKMVSFMMEKITFDLTKDIVVIDPNNEDSFSEDELFNIYDIGFAASVAYANDNFYSGEENIALIKIAGSDYPAMAFSEEEFDVGDVAYMFNSASLETGHVSDSDVYNVVLHDAVVVKKTSFALSTEILYQTDLTVSDQTGGSIVFNDNGEVFGMTSYSGYENVASNKDIPIDISSIAMITSVLDKVDVTHSVSVFDTLAKKGVTAVKNNNCREARTNFAVAFAADNPFIHTVSFNEYIANCAEEVVSDQQQDGAFSEILSSLQQRISAMTISDWVVLAALILLIIVLVVIGNVLIRKTRRKNGDVLKTNKKPERSEAMRMARRKPLGKKISIEEKEIERVSEKGSEEKRPRDIEKGSPFSSKTPVKTEAAIISKKSVDMDKKKEAIPQKEIKKDEVLKQEQEQKGSGDTLNVSVTQVVQNTRNQKVVGSVDTSSNSWKIPDGDKERLALLWPDKYGDDEKKDSTVHEKDEVNVIKKRVPVPVPSPKKEEEKRDDMGKRKEVKDRVEVPVYGAAADYIKNTRKLGFSNSEMRGELLRVGWKETDVDAAFNAVEK